MLRGDIVNYLVARFDYKSYLEIGIDNGRNYNRVRCDNKVGVEPDSKKCSFNSIINQTSDEYFSKLNDTVKFDIIFIDGDHHEEQVDKDIKNSLDHLNSGGIIVMHDCNPPYDASC